MNQLFSQQGPNPLLIAPLKIYIYQSAKKCKNTTVLPNARSEIGGHWQSVLILTTAKIHHFKKFLQEHSHRLYTEEQQKRFPYQRSKQKKVWTFIQIWSIKMFGFTEKTAPATTNLQLRSLTSLRLPIENGSLQYFSINYVTR